MLVDYYNIDSENDFPESSYIHFPITDYLSLIFQHHSTVVIIAIKDQTSSGLADFWANLAPINQ